MNGAVTSPRRPLKTLTAADGPHVRRRIPLPTATSEAAENADSRRWSARQPRNPAPASEAAFCADGPASVVLLPAELPPTAPRDYANGLVVLQSVKTLARAVTTTYGVFVFFWTRGELLNAKCRPLLVFRYGKLILRPSPIRRS